MTSQGPYVYALYEHYGYSHGDIATLFIVGFGSSMVFGTFVGGLADRFGRKANAVLFGVLYSLGCLTKHSSNFQVLLVGRVLGGISTSILMSAFETWMIHEHKKVRRAAAALFACCGPALHASSCLALAHECVVGCPSRRCA